MNREDVGSAASVVIEKGSKNDTIDFQGCCFNTTVPGPHDGTPAHIYSQFVGSVTFVLPMCFDLSKEESLLFEGGQDPGQGMNIFNCFDCQPLPFTEFESETVPESPEDASHGWDDVPMTGVIAGSVVIIVFIVVGAVLVSRRGKDMNDEYPKYTDDNAAMASNLMSNPDGK